jgi:hypothetical protein
VQWRENPHHSGKMDDEKWLWRNIRALRSSFGGTPASSRGGARPGMAAAAKPQRGWEPVRARLAAMARCGGWRRTRGAAEGRRRGTHAQMVAGGGEWRRRTTRARRPVDLGFETIEKLPTDMTGRTHASVERRMNRRRKNRSVGRTVGATELRGETRHRMVRRPIFTTRRSSCARVWEEAKIP